MQYASATGTGTWQTTPLAGTIPPGRNYLVKEAAGTGGTVDLPTPDATGSIAMSGTAGKVALVMNSTALTGACPAGAISDLVGYGAANCSETTPTAALTNTTSASRKGGGTIDSDHNADDFTVGPPDPQPSADRAPTVSSTTPSAGASGVLVDSNISITFSEPVNVTPGWNSISCASSGAAHRNRVRRAHDVRTRSHVELRDERVVHRDGERRERHGC